MNLTHTALLIIDVQLGMYQENDIVYQGEHLLATLRGLIAKARASRTPVIYIQHCGSSNSPLHPDMPGWPIHPAVAPLPGDLIIQKHHPDAFQDTALQAELQSRGIQALVIAGIQTEFCVDTTCRRAYSLGYTVTLVKDGHSTWNNDRLTATQIIDHHNLTLANWFATVQNAEDVFFS